jgi:hypothetical protein
VGGAAAFGVASDVDCDMIRTLSRTRLGGQTISAGGAQPRLRGPWPPNPLFPPPGRTGLSSSTFRAYIQGAGATRLWR